MRNTTTGRFVGRPKEARACGFCKKVFTDYSSNSRVYCTKMCAWKSQLINPSDSLGAHVNVRAKRYRERNWTSLHCKCPDCGGSKHKYSIRCRPCNVVSRTGEKSPYFKGGYENHKKHNRQRAQRIKILGNHTPSQWEELKSHYLYMCLCCKKQEPFIKLTRDHIVPIVLGGSDEIANIQPLCLSCNVRKYTKIINYIELSETAGVGL